MDIETRNVGCVECLVALIRTCHRSSNVTGKRRREMTGVSRVLGRLDMGGHLPPPVRV